GRAARVLLRQPPVQVPLLRPRVVRVDQPGEPVHRQPLALHLLTELLTEICGHGRQPDRSVSPCQVFITLSSSDSPVTPLRISPISATLDRVTVGRRPSPQMTAPMAVTNLLRQVLAERELSKRGLARMIAAHKGQAGDRAELEKYERAVYRWTSED